MRPYPRLRRTSAWWGPWLGFSSRTPTAHRRAGAGNPAPPPDKKKQKQTKPPSEQHEGGETLGWVAGDGRREGRGEPTSFLRFCATWSWTVTLSRVFGLYLSTHSIFLASPPPPPLLERERGERDLGFGSRGERGEIGGNLGREGGYAAASRVSDGGRVSDRWVQHVSG